MERSNQDYKNRNKTEKKKPIDKEEKEVDPKIAGDFKNFAICEKSIENLKKTGISYLFPIQSSTFNAIYQGKDLIGRDRTGSGKTLAFTLPNLEKFRKENRFSELKRGQRPLIVVIVPTRELCIQVGKEYERFKNSSNEYRVLTVYGGTPIYNQIRSLEQGVEVVVGTPGRLMDLQDRGNLSMRSVEVFILDEVDQMLNFGFQEDIEKILKKTKDEFETINRKLAEIQYLLFSATVPKWIDKIASKFLKPDIFRVDMIKDQKVRTSKTVEHLSIFFANKDAKIKAIGDVVSCYGGAHSRTIIFTDKKAEANDILLNGQLKFDSQVLHGDIPQKQREVTFQTFKSGNLKCLIATNVAARGLDIPKVDLIIQLTPPNEIDSYIHRSGRTGRAGKNGVCITFCTKWEANNLKKIENQARITIKKVGIPQIPDIMKANARDISLGFDKVSDDVIPYFEDTAKDIFSKYNSEEALCRALAIITGYTKMIQQRSLLMSNDNHFTFIVEGDYEVRSVGYFWNILRKYFSPQIVDSIKGMKLLNTKKGVAFDIPDQHKAKFEEIGKTFEEGMKCYIATELPEMEEQRMQNYGNRNGGNRGYGNRGYNNRNNGGYNNRNGGGNSYGNRNGGGNSYGNRNGGGGGGSYGGGNRNGYSNGGSYGGNRGGGGGSYGNSSNNSNSRPAPPSYTRNGFGEKRY